MNSCKKLYSLGRFLLTVFAGLSELERNLVRERTEEGRQAAKKRGVQFGRMLKLTTHQHPGALTIDNSIIVNPNGDGSPISVSSVDMAAVIDINCILTNDSEGFNSITVGVVTHMVVDDPAFVDRGTGNLQLATGSAAIDMCPEVIEGHDLAFRERNHDVVVPLMTSAKGVDPEFSDMGAFEFIEGVIFADGFEFEGPPVR